MKVLECWRRGLGGRGGEPCGDEQVVRSSYPTLDAKGRMKLLCREAT